MSSVTRTCLALLFSLTSLQANAWITFPAGWRTTQTPARRPLSARQVAQKVLPSVVYIEMEASAGRPPCYGSGFFVSRTEILTNKHVVTCSTARRGTVRLAGGSRSFPTTTILAWPDLDLALIEAEGLSAQPLQLAVGGGISVGDDIFVAGNPAGLEGTFTRGIVSGVRSREGLLQIDAPVSRGSSGGPVVDAYGQVVGITISSITEGQNLNFAIPAPALVAPLERMRRMMAEQKRARPESRPTADRQGSLGSLPAAFSPARRAWESDPDWAKFASPVVGDSVVRDALKALLDSGVSPDAADRHGHTALHLAAVLGQAGLARFLLSRRAAVDARDRQGRTPLMLAVRLEEVRPSADYSQWERLWTESPCAGGEAGDPFPKATDDLLGWHLRAEAREPVVRLLLDAGADAGLADGDGLTALDHASLGGPNEFDRLILRGREGRDEVASSCRLTLERSPTLNGLHLGMGLREVLARFPPFEPPPADSCGRVTLRLDGRHMKPREHAIGPEEIAVARQLRLTFIDERLAFIQMFYDRSTWKGQSKFLERLSASLRVPGKWRPAAGVGTWVQVHAIGCDGFKVMAGHAAAPYVELHDTATLRILLRRGVEARAKRGRAEQERRRQTVKPEGLSGGRPRP